MRRVIWSGPARQDYLEIARYISTDNPSAAERVQSAIERTGDGLATFATGHPGRFSGTYEKSVSRLPYIIVYALSGDDKTILILRVTHASRDWGAAPQSE